MIASPTRWKQVRCNKMPTAQGSESAAHGAAASWGRRCTPKHFPNMLHSWANLWLHQKMPKQEVKAGCESKQTKGLPSCDVNRRVICKGRRLGKVLRAARTWRGMRNGFALPSPNGCNELRRLQTRHKTCSGTHKCATWAPNCLIHMPV